MISHNLSETDKKALIARYESDLRRLQYQISVIKRTLSELHDEEVFGIYEDTPNPEPSVFQKPKAPVKIRKQKKLSEKDNLIIRLLIEAGEPLKSKEIVDKMPEYIDKYGVQIDKNTLKHTVNNLLQKLANNKGVLQKIDSNGQGFSYTVSSDYIPNF